jgi:DNA-binding NarL/FixJ family response regulator
MGERVLDLVSSIYASIDDDDAHNALIGRLAAATGATHSWLPLVGSDGALADVLMQNFPVHDVIGPYSAHYFQIDPWKLALDRLPVGRSWRLDRLVPVQAMLRSEIYNDLILPMTGDLVHCMSTPLPAYGGTSFLNLMRTQRAGAFCDADEALITALTPHLRRMLSLRTRLRQLGKGARFAEDALDVLTFGVLRCEAGGRIFYANAAARAMLAAKDGLRAVPALECASRSATAALQARLRAVLQGKVAESALLVERPSGRAAYRLVVLPVDARPRNEQALVVVHDPERREPSLAQRAADLFGLSPAEADLAVGLAHGETVQEVADRRQVRISTVRSQVQSALAKTGAARQTDLVRTVLLLGAVRRD